MGEQNVTTGEQVTRESIGELLANPWFCEELFDRTEDIVFFIKDRQARYVAVSNSLVARCRVSSKGDLLGKTCLELFPEPLASFFTEQDRQVLDKGVDVAGRLELHLYLGGARGWCLTDKIPLYDRAQNVIGLAGISRDLHGPGESSAAFKQVAEAVEYLRTHFSESLRIGDLAEKVGLSISRFERLVSKIYGLNPNQLLIKSRIDAASQMLADGNDSIADIAYACGYADHSAFTRQFRSAVGLTPSQFRAAAKQKP